MFRDNVKSRFGVSFKSGLVRGDAVAEFVCVATERRKALQDSLHYQAVMDKSNSLTRQLRENDRKLDAIEGE